MNTAAAHTMTTIHSILQFCLFSGIFLFLVAEATGQDIQISPPDTFIYQLPNDIKIQSSARIGRVTLAVWGTQREDLSGGEVRNALVMQIARNKEVVGNPQFVHSDSSVPYSMVKVITLEDRFCVFWYDRRSVQKGLYMRVIDTLGNLIGNEVWFGDAKINDIEIIKELPTSRVVLTSNGQYFLRPDGTTDPRPITIDLWRYRSYSILKDTSVVIVTADSIIRYKSIFENTVIAGVGLTNQTNAYTYSRFIVVDSLQQVHYYYNQAYDTVGMVYNPYIRYFEKGTWHMVRLIYTKYDPSLNIDSSSIIENFYISSSPRFNGPRIEYGGTHIVRMCDSNQLGVIFRRMLYSEIPFSDDSLNYYWTVNNSGSIYRAGIYPKPCRSEQPINRLAGEKESIVIATNDSIIFAASIFPKLHQVQYDSPMIHKYNNELYVSYFGDQILNPLMKWDGRDQIGAPIPLPKGEGVPLPTKRIVYGDFNGKPGEYKEENLIMKVQNDIIFAKMTYRRDCEVLQSSNGDVRIFAHLQYQIETFISDDSALSKFSLWREDNPEIGVFQLPYLSAYDPNASEIMHAVSRKFICGKVRSTNTRYLRKPHKSILTTSNIVIAGNGALLILNGTSALLVDSANKELGKYSITPVSGLSSYQRLLGNYFLRISKPDTTSIRLESFTLTCTPVNAVDIALAAPYETPFVLQNPKDSSLIVLSGTKYGVKATILDKNLKILTADSLISSSTGETATPSAILKNDTLYFVYTAIRSPYPSVIYGGGVILPNRIEPIDPIDITGGQKPDTSIINIPPENSLIESKPQFSISPNIVTDMLNLRFLNNESGEVSISLYSPLGNIITTESFPLVLAGEQHWSWNPAGVANGMYRLSVQTSTGKYDAPVIIAK